MAHKAGVVHFHRSPSLNDEPLIFDAMADIVSRHLNSGEVCSRQYPINCAGCVNPICRSICNPIAPYDKMRDIVHPAGELALANPVRAMNEQQPQQPQQPQQLQQ